MPITCVRADPLDFRRHIRPFFLTPSGSPTKYKPIYDFLSYLTTQLAFSFATAPFILLDLTSCMLVWSRVYFYCIFGVALSMAFFASPAKPYLAKTLQHRNAVASGKDERPGMGRRTTSQGSVGSIDGETVLGLPSDPARDFDEAMQEVKEEVEAIRSRGNRVTPAKVQQFKHEKGL